MTKYIFGLAAALCLLPGIAAGGTLWSAPDGTDANIVGHVVDRTSGQHMPFVTVALRGTTIGTVTDRTGHYYLKNLPQGDFVLVVSSIGYRSVSHNLTLTPGQTVEMNFELEEDAVALDAVVVSANRSETAFRNWPKSGARPWASTDTARRAPTPSSDSNIITSKSSGAAAA